MKPILLLACLTVLLGSASVPALCASQEPDKPTILIYAHDAISYAGELRDIIQADQRIDAHVEVTTSPDIFRLMLYFPSVKVAVFSLSVERDDGLGPALEWFFSEGGGLIALGVAALDTSAGNASRTAFPLFATGYKTGTMDRVTRKFTITHLKEEVDEISEGVPSFTVRDHKVAMSLNRTTKSYEPVLPETGKYKVLFRDSLSGAPSVVKYQNRGASLTFASFGGDDHEQGYSYFKGFSETAEFRTLFANAVNWAWEAESKYERHQAQAKDYYESRARHFQDVEKEAAELESRARSANNLRILLTFGLAAVGCIGIYWATFARPTKP